VGRRSSGLTPIGQYSLVGSSPSSGFVDSSAASSTSYLYRIEPVDGNDVAGPISAADLATTVIFEDEPLAPGVTKVRAAHWTQLRDAVNAVRVLAGIGPTSFTTSTRIKVDHLTEIRSALDAARTALGMPALSYADEAATVGTPVRAIHVQEIRNAVK